MAITQKLIKGIKVNGEIAGLDLSRIGSVVHAASGEETGDTELVEYIDSHGGGGGGGTVTELTSQNGTKFNLKVYDNGELYADEIITDTITPEAPVSTERIGKIKGRDIEYLYINSFYCGGLNSNEHTLNYCSHNFVELSNLSNKNICLDNMSLQYRYSNSAWTVFSFKDKGYVIKAGGTFLIRFNQCSNIDGAKILVDDYDVEITGSTASFSTESPSFYLCFGDEPASESTNPGWIKDGTKTVDSRFIDLIGVKTVGDCNAYVNSAYTCLMPLNEVMFRRYYAMDNVKQGTKDIANMSNATEWYYVDLTKDDGDVIPSIKANTPKARIDSKNLYFDKSKLFENKPTVITCSFGIEAVDKEDGNGATRCFNWVSKGRHNEFIWIRKEGTSDWGTAHESFKSGSLDPEYTRFGNYAQYYNRQYVEYNDGVVFTAHKYIMHRLEKGTYEYIAGRANKNGSPILNECTDIRKFTVRRYSDVENGFKYVQTSDQQGFNWNEYRVWEAAAKLIATEGPQEDESHQVIYSGSKDVQFMINTGDMVQNGSRICEWIDYFDSKGEFLNNMEEMATVGNNDLSPKYTYELPDGEDASKLSLTNFNYFYTYEMDVNNPPVFNVQVTGGSGEATYYIPSLYSFNYGKTHFMCVNTEIKNVAETAILPKQYPDVYGCNHSGQFYPQIKTWCEKDISANTSEWRVAYCHELPFHILTTGVTYEETKEGTTTYAYDNIKGDIKDGSGGDGRKGSQANWNLVHMIEDHGTPRYWFSEFCQTHNIRLVMGGHKHTQATSWPILENVSYSDEVRSILSYRPVIVLTNVEDYKFKDDDPVSTTLVSGTAILTKPNVPDLAIPGRYPNEWVDSETGLVKNAYNRAAAFCTFALKSEMTGTTQPVVYAMSQATSYKHTSNKELPSDVLAYLKHYYPTPYGSTAANDGQKFPFYTVWTVNTNTSITGEVRKAVGIFDNKGKFDINKDWPYVSKGISTIDRKSPIASVNGLGSNTTYDPDEKIVISKS